MPWSGCLSVPMLRFGFINKGWRNNDNVPEMENIYWHAEQQLRKLIGGGV